jgi:hypothetical protein
MWKASNLPNLSFGSISINIVYWGENVALMGEYICISKVILWNTGMAGGTTGGKWCTRQDEDGHWEINIALKK